MRERWHPSRWDLKFYAIAAAFLAAVNLMGPNGFIHWVLLRQETGRLAARTRELDREVRDMSARMEHFRSSRVARERAIREELGYLKPDEISVEIAP